MPRSCASANTRPFTCASAVAAIAMNAPSRSATSAYSRSSHSIAPSRASSRVSSSARGATTVTRAPASSREAIFAVAISPAPTTTHLRPLSFRNIGNRPGALISLAHSMRHRARRQIARLREHLAPRQLPAQLFIRVTREILPQIFAAITIRDVRAQQAFDGFGHLARGAAVAAQPRDTLIRSHRAAQAEVVRVHQVAPLFYFLSFEADVCDPVLPARIRAAGDVQLELLIEIRDALLEFLHHPTRKSFRLGDRELAEIRSVARD